MPPACCDWIGSSPSSGRKKKNHTKWCGFSFWWLRTRTHSSATCRWHVAATSANTGGFLYFRLRRKCKSSPVVSNNTAQRVVLFSFYSRRSALPGIPKPSRYRFSMGIHSSKKRFCKKAERFQIRCRWVASSTVRRIFKS